MTRRSPKDWEASEDSGSDKPHDLDDRQAALLNSLVFARKRHGAYDLTLLKLLVNAFFGAELG